MKTLVNALLFFFVCLAGVFIAIAFDNAIATPAPMQLDDIDRSADLTNGIISDGGPVIIDPIIEALD